MPSQKKSRTKPNHWIGIVLLLLALGSTLSVVEGQPSGASTREDLLAAIKARAHHDVEFEQSMATLKDLEAAFEDQAGTNGLALAEVVSVYQQAYAEERSKQTWWRKVEPISWALAVLVPLVTILWSVLQKGLEGFAQKLFERTFSFVAGFRIFWLLALRTYRATLISNFEKLLVPFRPGRPLRLAEVFVPLKVSGRAIPERIDIQTAVRSFRCLVVIGAPGAGKTMLMRHLAMAIAQADSQKRQGRLVPILLELHRLNEGKPDLLSHLTQALERMKFPNAGDFINSGLNNGTLLLLFDGLDEVNQEIRDHAVQEIKDVLQRSPDCRAVVTCRSAVYNDEFAGWSDSLLEVIEFDDQQIRRFLNGWATEMPLGKSVEHLIATLSERPLILALARNPLLLTIIAFLYCDTSFVLPHSRTEFYKKATQVLLKQWDKINQRRNLFRASHKGLILRALALFFQDRASSLEKDRRSASLTETLLQMNSTLSSLNLDQGESQAVLDEIVERSGLVLALEGETRYQFSHLSLQEFFAALAMKDRVEDLQAKLEHDFITWRETAKMWCGLGQDSTSLIRFLKDIDEVTALECLSDAESVEPDYSDLLIKLFWPRLDSNFADSDAIRNALALVAAGNRAPGIQLKADLIETLKDSEAPPSFRLGAAQVLSRTNLPEAAAAVVEGAILYPAWRPHLVNLGDLAVQPLTRWMKTLPGGVPLKDIDWLIDVLASVGTPAAAMELATLLWNADRAVRTYSAWRLAEVLRQPGVEMALRSLPSRPEYRKSDRFGWIWEPFEPSHLSPLRAVASRLSFLLSEAADVEPPSELGLKVDPRLAIPLCAVVAQEGILMADRRTLWLEFSQLRGRFYESSPKPQDLEKFVQLLFPKKHWRIMFNTLGQRQQIRIIESLLESKPTPSEDDWRHVLQPARYSFRKSTQALGFLTNALLLTLLGVSGLAYESALQGRFTGLFWLPGFLCFLVAFVSIFDETVHSARDAARILLPLGFFFLPGSLIAIQYFGGNYLSSLILGSAIGLFGGVFIGAGMERRTVLMLLFAAAGGFTLMAAVVGFGLSDFLDRYSILTLTGGIKTAIVCYLVFGLGVEFACLGTLYFMFKRSPEEQNRAFLRYVSVSVLFAIGGILGLPVLLFPTLLISDNLGQKGVWAFWAIWFLMAYYFAKTGERLERLAKNPFHGLLGTEIHPANAPSPQMNVAPDVVERSPWRLFSWRLPHRSTRTYDHDDEDY